MVLENEWRDGKHLLEEETRKERRSPNAVRSLRHHQGSIRRIGPLHEQLWETQIVG
jgi:hypothetical protein